MYTDTPVHWRKMTMFTTDNDTNTCRWWTEMKREKNENNVYEWVRKLWLHRKSKFEWIWIMSQIKSKTMNMAKMHNSVMRTQTQNEEFGEFVLNAGGVRWQQRKW